MSGQGWRRRHLLDVADLSAAETELILSLAEAGPAANGGSEGRRVATLFYEPSTRTRVSFEIAARRLGADVVDVSVATSSVTKGESLADTVRTLRALGIDILVIRHPQSGAADFAARHFGGAVVNAGDGWHAHPTQALLDLWTLRHALDGGTVDGRKIVIVGDIVHSRVARSNIWLLTTMGADVWLCGPSAFVRGFDAWARAMPRGRRLTVTTEVDAALDGAAAVMALRIQRERLTGPAAGSTAGYAARYGITAGRLARSCPEAFILHPGPVNEGVELDPDVSTGERSLITEQVRRGVDIRAAVLALVATRLDG
jgi:aspartate carbamoyltransferase catalytic subunit